MSYRTAAGTALLAFVGAHWSLVLLINPGIVSDLPMRLWWVWVFGIAVPAIVSWVALALAICLEDPAKWRS